MLGLTLLPYRLMEMLQPNHQNHKVRTIRALLRAERWNEAAAKAQALIAEDEQNPWHYELLAKVQIQQQQFAAAVESLHRAIAIDPQIHWLHYHLGVALPKLGQVDQAIASLQESIRLHPSFAWAHYHLGELLLDQDKFAEATAVYREGLAQDARLPVKPQLEYAEHFAAGHPATVEILLKYPPKLHIHEGRLVCLGVSESLARFLEGHAQPGSHTLETGAGLSTIIFAMKGTHHTAVIPDPELAERIKTYCRRRQINPDQINFELARSETILPKLATDHALDMVLIDGRHAFPSPFIDWYYTTDRLNLGGIVIVDDTQLWTGDVLKQFLKMEAEWEMIDEFPQGNPTAAAFKKLQSGSNDKWWAQQPYAIQQAPVPAQVVS
jgi:predicted negative regulator of RcsB-dependent stress response